MIHSTINVEYKNSVGMVRHTQGKEAPSLIAHSLSNGLTGPLQQHSNLT